jgi:DNA-directed RNA polymerase subunit RPC12/RpoP
MNNDAPTFLLGLPVILVILLWLVLPVVAAVIAPADRRGTFFLITLLFLGPLGVVAAAVAQPRTPLYVQLATREPAPGRMRIVCARCGAESDLPAASTTFECWQCPHRAELKPTAHAAPESTPTRPTRLLDVMSGDIDDVPRRLRELRQQRR